jgi:hypothetical protein
MTFAREKRLLLGGLALFAPIPLPFNQILGWVWLAVYLATLVLFLRRAAADRGPWLPNWAMNVLAVTYLPFFLFDALALSRGRVVVSVTHLLLFAIVVKLFGMRQERDKWQIAIATLFLVLTSMATSVHPSVVLYLVGIVVLALRLLTGFARLHVMAGFVSDEAPPTPVPLRGFLAAATLATLVVAVPLFAFLPRVRTPFIMGRGEGAGTLGSATGFTNEVTLDTIGSIRTSREVAMRLTYDRQLTPSEELRFKAGGFELYEDGRWRKRSHEARAISWRQGLVLSEGVGLRPNGSVQVFLRPLFGRALPLPIEALALDSEAIPLIFLGEEGAAELRQEPRDVIEYRVALASRPVPLALRPDAEPGAAERRAALLDTRGFSAQVADLAERVAGTGTPREQARRLESHLFSQYRYSLEFVGQVGAEPLDDFLFRRHEGHCEYFASALVALLRYRGIPARLATGFLGAEYNPLEGYWVVRQSNAHAWVEAWLEGEGWVTLDPTPEAGRPQLDRGGLRSLFSQGWDYVLFRWDRYVLTYGFFDQMQLLTQLKEAWDGLWGSLWGKRGDDPPASAPGVEEAPPLATAEGETEERSSAGRWLVVALVAVFGSVAMLLWRRSQRPVGGIVAYGRLRKAAGRNGLPASLAQAPYRFQDEVARHRPRAAEPTARVVELYLRESYGGGELTPAERIEVTAALREAVRAIESARRADRATETAAGNR